MDKPFFEMTNEEIHKMRANSIEYIICDGRLLKKVWNEEGTYSILYAFEDGAWDIAKYPTDDYLNHYGDPITEEEAKIKMQLGNFKD